MAMGRLRELYTEATRTVYRGYENCIPRLRELYTEGTSKNAREPNNGAASSVSPKSQ